MKKTVDRMKGKAKPPSKSAPPKKRSGRATRAGVVKKLLKKVEAKLGSEDVKATFGDYIRLVELQKELEAEEPREIKVTWVEPSPEGERKSENGE